MPVNHAPNCVSQVVLLRPEAGGGFEFYMARGRIADNSYGELFAFPAGLVKREDCHEGMIERCLGLEPMEARRILGSELTPELSLGHWTAGVRRLFEEIGVLLCTKASGAPTDMTSRPWVHNLDRSRALLVNGTLDFKTILKSEDLFCDVGSLRYLSHWSNWTSEDSTAAYGARYFLARLPSYQGRLPSPHPESSGLWITPEGALNQFEKGKFNMEFPTFATLRTLADFDSLEDLWGDYERSKNSKPA